jgi:Family of unknown function (DUF6498)
MTTWKDITKKRFTQSDWSLILANLLPVFGVWFYGWDAKEVFLVYAIETLIAGLFTIIKLFIAGQFKKKDVFNTDVPQQKQSYWFFIFFFIIHYGMFVAIQMAIFFSVSGITGDSNTGFFSFYLKWPSLLKEEAWIMLSVFIVSYTIKMITDFIMTEEYKNVSLGQIMFQPYGRIFIQQVTVIIGSMFLSFGAGKIFILVFAFIKIYFEVFIDFNLLMSKAAKGELKSNEEDQVKK